ncbi:TetR/AcrR family transcriptional regulator [Gulosibacter molinativorax]|uniref:TetR/AcrR family transcriptional regulator n=1 Tax=Gulosibacter molinativorax TaxID=256821 RepID=A0ABT7C5R1_9MICO|nr:TetR/AcrR family transcriptional regulator [Gulosibacter molinativorax]MDJ1370438.1 TetR/AcrR family transcriptional regulator [Gulosibacter molinativorax]QUY61351.1 TetR [Gulosibacter molinativorax]
MPEQTTTAARRGRPGNDRSDVINAAVALFNQHGYEATTVGMIAEQLGVSKSAIYHHVTSKEDLLASALDRALSSLEGMLAEAKESGATPVDRLERTIRGTVTVLIEELQSVTLLLRLRGNTDLERAALDRRRKFNVSVAELMNEADETGSLRTDIDPGVATRFVFGMVNSIIDWYRPGGPLDADMIGDHIVGVVFDGLRPRS